MALSPLTDSDIEAVLPGLAGWSRQGDHLRAEFVFPNFKAALAFMVEVGEEAERLNHHPEWSNVYNRVTVGLTTHDAGGLTSLDFELAQAMNSAAERHRSS